MANDARMLGKADLRLGGVLQVIRVHAVDDVAVMAHVTQRVTKAMNIHRVAAKTVWRVKRCQVQEVQRARHEATGHISFREERVAR